MLPDFCCNKLAITTIAGVDDTDMNCPRRKRRNRVVPDESSSQNLLWRNLVRQVDKLNFWVDTQDNPFHLGDVCIPGSKIGQECDAGSKRRLE